MRWLIPPVLVLLLAAAMVVVARQAPPAPLLPGPYGGVLGGLLIALGVVLVVAAARQLARARTNLHAFHKPQVLVEDGLYAFSRNPIYLGFALALLGWAVVLGPLVNLALVALFVLIADRWYIASEERMAEEVFGAAYDAYRRRTRRWL